MNVPQQLVDKVDKLLGNGYLDRDRVEVVASAVPELEANVDRMLHKFAASRDWRRFVRYSIVASYIHPVGLGEVICEVLDSGEVGARGEDLVEILGEIGYVDAVPSILKFMNRNLVSDDPYFSLSIKCVHAIGDIGSDEARSVLRELTNSGWPNPVRWNAAIVLGIEEDLGFDEDEMLN